MTEVSTPAPAAEKAEEKPIYVKAVRKGFYNGRRRFVGEIFRLNSIADFSDARRKKPYSGWMKVVEKVSEDFEEAEGYVTRVKNEGRELRYDRGEAGDVPNEHTLKLAEEQRRLRQLRGELGQNDPKPKAPPAGTPTGDATVI